MNIYNQIKKAFDEGSSDYLEDDIHWGDDSDLIFEFGKKLAAELNKKIRILYAGVGPGFILGKILSQNKYWNQIVAIDFSNKMLNIARNRLRRLAKIEPAILQQIYLRKMDLLKLKEKFDPKTFDIVLCLNNTLGNIVLPNGDHPLEQSFEEAKSLVLDSFSYVLRKGGLLILSVYNIEKINICSEHYTKNLKIIDKINSQSFLLQFCKNGKNYNFFTHWFNEKEINDIIIGLRLKIIKKFYRRNRIIVIAKKL